MPTHHIDSVHHALSTADPLTFPSMTTCWPLIRDVALDAALQIQHARALANPVETIVVHSGDSDPDNELALVMPQPMPRTPTNVVNAQRAVNQLMLLDKEVIAERLLVVEAQNSWLQLRIAHSRATTMKRNRDHDRQRKHHRRVEARLVKHIELQKNARDTRFDISRLGVERLSSLGVMNVAVRRNMVNVGTANLGLVLLDKISRQTVARCEFIAACVFLGVHRAFFDDKREFERDLRNWSGSHRPSPTPLEGDLVQKTMEWVTNKSE
jgi:hypothetical protein